VAGLQWKDRSIEASPVPAAAVTAMSAESLQERGRQNADASEAGKTGHLIGGVSDALIASARDAKPTGRSALQGGPE
jgi:hypothetical protein